MVTITVLFMACYGRQIDIALPGVSMHPVKNISVIHQYIYAVIDVML